MSLERALRAIQRESTDRIPHWELISCPAFEQAVSGVDPSRHPQQAALRTIAALDLDVAQVPETDDPLPPFPEDGVDEDGHRVGRWGGSTTWRWDWGQAFESEEDVLAYEPLEHLDLSGASVPGARDYTVPLEELALLFGERVRRSRDLLGHLALPDVAGWYNTFFMWPLLTFGWELFLTTAMQYPEEIARIMADFGEISIKVFEAWAIVCPPLVVSHDDICYTRGPVFSPEWLRANVYPWYERLWAPLRRRGIKVVFMSDGNLDDVVDDVFACGADGIVAEPYTNLEDVARRYPDKVIVGNADNRVLARGDPNEIYAEVERCTRLGLDCPGYFYSVTNHITYDLPVEAVRCYFEACDKLGRR